MNISVKNLRDETPDWKDPRNVYVGRGAKRDLYGMQLGNPYVMHGESDRDRVCDAVKHDVDVALRTKTGALYHQLSRLHMAYIVQDELTLWCWCAPKRCHATEYVLAIRRMEREMEDHFHKLHTGQQCDCPVCKA